MEYSKIVEMWNEMHADEFGDWDSISEERKIEYAYEEGKLTGFIEIADIATRLSEREKICFEKTGPH